MSTLTCQSTVIKDKDQVCLLNAGGTLGYQKCSYFPVKSVERLTQCCISGKVQGTGTVIQNQDFRFFYQGTGNGKSLFLAAGKVFTVLFQHKIKLSRFTLYYLFSLCCGKCLPQILVRGIFPAPFQIVSDRAFEKSCLLWNNADSGAEITSGVIFNILTIQQNSSFAGIIESGDQIYQSGFSASCTTDNTYGLSLFYRKTDMGKTRGTGFAVLKGYVIEYDGIFRK